MDWSADITSTRRVTHVWRGGQPCDLDSYVAMASSTWCSSGSADEAAGLNMLREQTDRVIAAARQLRPQAAAE